MVCSVPDMAVCILFLYLPSKEFFFKVFLVKFEWIVEFVCTYRISRLFGLREVHPPSEFRFHCLRF